MNKQHRLYIEALNAWHKWFNNHGNDEEDYQDFKQKSAKYKEFMKNE
jgi:hypothetical protein